MLVEPMTFPRAQRVSTAVVYAVLLGSSFPIHTVGAQMVATLRGRVLDTAGAPVANAEASLLGTAQRAITNRVGAFELRDVPAGDYRLFIRAVGFEPLQFNARFRSEPIEADFRLRPLVMTLDTVQSRESSDLRADLVGFEEHRKLGQGKFFTRGELEQRGGSTLRSLLPSKVTSFSYVDRPCRGVALASATPLTKIDLRTRRSIGQSAGCTMPDLCYAQIYVDGVRVFFTDHFNIPPSLEDYPLSVIEAIEVYTRSSETPARFNTPGAVCGTLALWMRR